MFCFFAISSSYARNTSGTVAHSVSLPFSSASIPIAEQNLDILEIILISLMSSTYSLITKSAFRPKWLSSNCVRLLFAILFSCSFTNRYFSKFRALGINVCFALRSSSSKNSITTFSSWF